jgi:serpin B
MRASYRILALAATLALWGCDSVSGPDDGGPQPPLTELPRALSAPERALIGASNRFAFGLLREAAARDTASTLFLSPLSASMALGMTLNGARGETFEEMRAALGFGALQPAEINASYRSLIDLLLGLDRSVEMRLANSIWVRQGFPLHDAFVQSSLASFDARIAALDFSSPDAVRTINGWVEQSTNGKIRTIQDRIHPDRVMYLINAVYFKGSWTKRFDARQTADAPFRRPDGTRQTVRMMHLAGAPARYLRNDEVEILDLPYGREAFSMTLLLPGRDAPLEAWAATLTAERWDEWMGRLGEMRLDVFLPRFRLEQEKILNETLKALGMVAPFDEVDADFGGMSPLGAELYVDEVKQKTFLEVNEEGTEAAAVTSVGIMPTSAPPSFRADRPFLLAIRERLSGTILFLGLIGAPPGE